MVIRHDDVDASLGGQIYLRGAARPAVGGHDQRPTLRYRPLDGAQRESMPVRQPLRNVRSDIQSEPPQREHQNRQARESIRVEVAVDQDSLAPRPRQRHPLEGNLGIGEQPGIVQPLLRRSEECRQLFSAPHAPGRQDGKDPL